MTIKVNFDGDSKRKEIVSRFDKPSEHTFDVYTGKCKKCGEFIGDIEIKLCPVISKEEINQFNTEGIL